MKPVKGREQLRAHLHKRQVRSELNRWKNLRKKTTNFGIEAQVVVLRLVCGGIKSSTCQKSQTTRRKDK